MVDLSLPIVGHQSNPREGAQGTLPGGEEEERGYFNDLVVGALLHVRELFKVDGCRACVGSCEGKNL